MCIRMGFAVALVAAGCGRSPVAPAPGPEPQPSLSGSWVGAHLVSCPERSNCGQMTGPPTGAQALSLLLQQAGDTLIGQINLGGWLARTADVTGSLAADGSFVLQGGMSWPAGSFCQPAGGWRLTAWRGRYDPRTDAISGSFSYVTQKHLSSCYYLQDLMVDATTMSLSRGMLADPVFTGHWQGTATQTHCTHVGWTSSCAPSSVCPGSSAVGSDDREPAPLGDGRRVVAKLLQNRVGVLADGGDRIHPRLHPVEIERRHQRAQRAGG